MPVCLGEGTAPIIVAITVPVWTCSRCCESYTDFEADDIRDAIIKALREAFALGKNLANG